MATLVNDGLEYMARLANNADSPAHFTYMANGSGTTAEANDQTTLTTENTASGMERAAATCAYEADYIAKWTKTWTNGSGGSVTVAEIGVFNAAADGKMLMRHKYTSSKTIADTEALTVIVKMTMARTS